jgi:glycosyltransferase involved in cell wall biosynthesis
MTSSALVSVALCTYNGARFLDTQLRSIAAQTLTPIEIIACDDGSSDGTVELLAECARAFSIPMTISRNDQRLGAARNFDQAMRLCTGDIIAFADQDDMWHRTKLERLAAALDAHPEAAYAFCDARLIDETGAEVGGKSLLARRFTLPSIREAFARGDELRLMLKRDFIYGTTLALRSSARDLLPPVPETWSHDTWIVNVLACLDRRGVPVLQPLVRYRQHGAQASGGTGAPVNVPDADRVRAYEDLRAALVALADAGHPLRPDALDRIDDKLRFLRAARDLKGASLPSRARSVASELLSGRWSRYSPRTLLVDKRFP